MCHSYLTQCNKYFTGRDKVEGRIFEQSGMTSRSVLFYVFRSGDENFGGTCCSLLQRR
jgi:hypothetical protein